MTGGSFQQLNDLGWRVVRLVHRLARAYIEFTLDEIARDRQEVGRDCAVCMYRGRCTLETHPLCHGALEYTATAPQQPPGRHGMH